MAGRGLFRIVLWLLTPFVAWAVSVFTAWIGALIGRGAGSLVRGASWLGGGALLGAIVGVWGWAWIVRRWERARETPEPPMGE